MSRFRFRAWDKTSKAMIHDYAHLKMYGELYVTQFHSLAYSDKGCPDLILMQSTGLPDKSGKHQFKGDIVDHPSAGTAEITWDQPRCRYMARSLVSGLYYPMSEDAEIIGNRFENHELLEAANEDNP